MSTICQHNFGNNRPTLHFKIIFRIMGVIQSTCYSSGLSIRIVKRMAVGTYYHMSIVVEINNLFILNHCLHYCIQLYCIHCVSMLLCISVYVQNYLRIMARIKRIIGAGGRIFGRNAKNCRIE